MDATLEAKLKTHRRLGTFFVELPQLSEAEGAPCVAQLRRLRGELYSVYLREQQRLGATMRQLQRLRDAEEAKAKAAEAADAEAPSAAMNEDEEKNVFQVVASMRTLLQHAVLRVFVDADGSLQVYKVSTAQTGEHAENEISLDVLERDYGPMVNRLLVKSGLIPDEPFPVPTGPPDDAGAGRGGEAVRPAPEPVGEGVAS